MISVHRAPGRILYLLPAIYLVAAFVSPGLLAASLFPNPVFPVGTNPDSMVSGDFDGDGKTDLIVSNFGLSYSDPSYTISLLRGQGDGTFSPEPVITIATVPLKLFQGDVNGDGRPDLIVQHFEGVGILVNQGNWTFAAETIVSGSVTLGYMDVGDYTGDGRLDILVHGPNGGIGVYAYQLLAGNVLGGFTPADPVPAPSLQQMAGADVNGDGRRDLVVAPDHFAAINDIRILLGAGDGTFQEVATLTTDELVTTILPLELNGDGQVDLLVDSLHPTENGLVPGPRDIFYGTGDGSFSPGPRENDGESIIDAVAGDFNRDGLRDYVTLQTYSDAVVRLGQADGSFLHEPIFYVGASSVKLALGDWNQDNVQDLAVLSNWAEAVFTYRGNPDGTFGPRIVAALQDALLAAAASGDFNGDGHADLAVGRVDANDVSVLMGNGDGTFGPEALYSAAFSPNAVIAADLDGDGNADLALVGREWAGAMPDPPPPGSLAVLHGNGDGTFGSPALLETGANPIRLLSTDVNGDGVVDLLILDYEASWRGIQSDVAVFLGQGSGTFALLGKFPAGFWANDIAVGDVNGDGRLDLAVTHLGTYSNDPPYEHLSGDVSLLLGNGDGSFQAPAAVSPIYSAANVALRDLNGDGRLDLIVTDEGSLIPQNPGGVEVLMGGAGGSFASPVPYAAGVGPFDLRLGDFDRDGFVDLLVADNAGDESFLHGRGDGTFDSPLEFALLGGATFIVEEDINGDGLPDLLVGSASGVFALLNQNGPGDSRTQVLEPILTVAPRKKSGTLSWSTDREFDLAGFNMVIMTEGRRTQLNGTLLDCAECTTGQGASYSFPVSRFRSGHRLFVEVVYRDGRTELFGPAALTRLSPAPLSSPIGEPHHGGKQPPRPATVDAEVPKPHR